MGYFLMIPVPPSCPCCLEKHGLRKGKKKKKKENGGGKKGWPLSFYPLLSLEEGSQEKKRGKGKRSEEDVGGEPASNLCAVPQRAPGKKNERRERNP